MINVLMIEDDPEFAEFLGEFLEKYNIKITNYQDPYMGLVTNFSNYDLVILDLTLPGMDGLEVCKEIRKKSDIPIIISSARSDVADKVLGLERGADYYLPKPYDPKEMYAVIMSLLRRSEKKEIIKKSLFDYDEKKQIIKFKDKILNLTYAEYEILLVLIKNKNTTLSREYIIENCETLNDPCGKSLDVIIGRLRKKLNDNAKNPKYIFSIRGMGYRLSE
ncbi:MULTISPECIES: response regulator transcription factor [unclassified Lebetimonas]|uniref:response regulator transcription factor n=1 Tax=unclassified Lebetimonas TaxID=2648158 RepID=UPI00046426DB|nr:MULTISPECIES: response regulator transcription factor [unclassified Lebetimonas]